MVTIPAKVKDRLIAGVKKFQPVVKKAQAKDINESDTVTIVSDILSDVFGYDKYSEITSEFAIKKTFCDLATQIGGVTKLLMEVKAVGLELKDQHVKQAVDYGANAGIEWVVLTNGVDWRVYNIVFGKPVMAELVYNFNLTTLNPKKQNELEMLYYLSRESMAKGNRTSLDDFHSQQQLVNKVMIAQILMADPVLDTVRKTLRKLSADLKISNDEIQHIITDEIIKRDVLDDDRAADAKKKVAKALKPAAKPAKATADAEK